MRLIFVRHGETDWNASLRYQGHAQIPLNDRGRWQATRAAERLSSRPIASIYASDLIRAWETATIIGKATQQTPQELSDLREIDVGHWQGLTPAELEERFPEHMQAYEHDPANTIRLGGESYAQLQERALRAFHQMTEQHASGDTVVAVSHGGTIRTVVCHVIGLDLKRFGQMWLDNGSITELELRPKGWRLLRLNDAAHLEE